MGEQREHRDPGSSSSFLDQVMMTSLVTSFADLACAFNLIRSRCSQSSCTCSCVKSPQHCENVRLSNAWVVMSAWDVVPWLH